MKRLLHVGCGGSSALGLFTSGFVETRLDVNPAAKPDVVADMRLVPFADRSFDGVYCTHALEHLEAPDAARTAAEWRRVVRDGGFALAIVPDFEAACAHIASGRESDPMYQSLTGQPIYAMDVIFGNREYMDAEGLMAHRTGFTRTGLYDVLRGAGFESIEMGSDGFNLWAVAKTH